MGLTPVTGHLHFSKTGTEVFALRTRAMVEFDKQAMTLKFTGIEKPSRGLAEKDCFTIQYDLAAVKESKVFGFF